VPFPRWALLFAVAVIASGAAAQATAAGKARLPVARSASTATLAPSAWRTWWGQASFGSNAVTLSSVVPTSPAETHSALITTKRTWSDQTFTVGATTLSQLRVGSTPNPWEVGWLMFRFQDLHDYYYFILKPNGIELGKKQGSDTQIFLVTADTPILALGQRSTLQVQTSGARIRVWANGSQVIDFTDPNPLRSGSIGLYEEDSQARFDSLTVGS
jgi:Domain of Unknown Function (DUF1080)